MRRFRSPPVSPEASRQGLSTPFRLAAWDRLRSTPMGSARWGNRTCTTSPMSPSSRTCSSAGRPDATDDIDMSNPISASGSGPILTLRNISKSFGGTRALSDAQLDLYPGKVAALIGENGAGKSTLVKILTGIYGPDGGVIRLDGSPVRINSPSDAQKLGISAIHQESVVFDDVSVAENIFVTTRPRRYGLIDWGEMRRRAASILAQLEANIDPTTLMRDLSVAQKHLVQIARALSHDSRIVIMDEPTAALSHHEAEDLLRIVRMPARGRPCRAVHQSQVRRDLRHRGSVCRISRWYRGRRRND